MLKRNFFKVISTPKAATEQDTRGYTGKTAIQVISKKFIKYKFCYSKHFIFLQLKQIAGTWNQTLYGVNCWNLEDAQVERTTL